MRQHRCSGGRAKKKKSPISCYGIARLKSSSSLERDQCDFRGINFGDSKLPLADTTEGEATDMQDYLYTLEAFQKRYGTGSHTWVGRHVQSDA